MIDSITSLAFSLFENKGVYAILLGSGLSRAAQIPTGWEITLDLIRRIAALQNVTSEADWAAWYRNQIGKEPNYSEVLDAVSSSPDERRSILHSYIEPTEDDLLEGRKIPTPAHHAIAWLVREGFIRVILTTNFDRLTENALREAGVEPVVIRSDDDLAGAVPLIHTRCYMIKLHGDYMDTRIKNTDEELGAYSAYMNGMLDRILDEHGLIVCGWSGEWDHALRAAIARAPNRRFPTFWTARGPIPAKANDLIQHRLAKIISITDADAFFGGLQQKIASQVEDQRPNPRSTELIVGTVKRYLARPEHRIRLHGLLVDENRRLASRLNDTTVFMMSGGGSIDDYRLRVRRYQAATETLMRILGTMGRWGDDAAYAMASEIVRDLAFLKIEGGLNWWLELRLYPAVLLFYSFGLGTLKAGLYHRLFNWFTQPVRRDQRNTQPFVEGFAGWQSETGGQWKMLEGLERNKTPFSDHVHSSTLALTADITLGDREHTRLFETFEVLTALAYLTVATTRERLQEAHDDKTQQSYVWAPIGRAGWDSGTRDQVLKEIEQPETFQALLKAGFGSGDKEHLNLALTSVRRLMGRMQWQ